MNLNASLSRNSGADGYAQRPGIGGYAIHHGAAFSTMACKVGGGRRKRVHCLAIRLSWAVHNRFHHHPLRVENRTRGKNQDLTIWNPGFDNLDPLLIFV